MRLRLCRNRGLGAAGSGFDQMHTARCKVCGIQTDQLSGASLIDNDYSTYNETNCGIQAGQERTSTKPFPCGLGKSREIAQVKLMPRVVPYGGTFPTV